MSLIEFRWSNYFYFLFFISLASYLAIHYEFSSFNFSKIDIFYGIALISVLLCSIIQFKNEFLKTIKINLIAIFSFIIIVELLFFLEIFSNVALKPVTLRSEKSQMVQNLNDSPWYKFAPNKEVYSQGYRGEDFIHNWITDDYGYKNPTTNKVGVYEYIALGDSFTEGMGVRIEHAWPYLAGKNHGVDIYNAGVQGYSASQLYGTLKMLSRDIEFKNIIVGHFPETYIREASFVNSPSSATGGIESIRVNSSRKRLVLPQLIQIFTKYKDVPSLTKINKELIENHRFVNYAHEIKILNSNTRADLLLNPWWKRTIDEYVNIAEWAQKNKKSLTFIGFPHRYEVYFSYEELRIKDKNNLQYFIEWNQIKHELNDYDINFVDTFTSLKSYVDKVKDGEPLPYFEKDGHMSQIGHILVANELAQSL